MEALGRQLLFRYDFRDSKPDPPSLHNLDKNSKSKIFYVSVVGSLSDAHTLKHAKICSFFVSLQIFPGRSHPWSMEETAPAQSACLLTSAPGSLVSGGVINM